jgi:hypothetical protein
MMKLSADKLLKFNWKIKNYKSFNLYFFFVSINNLKTHWHRHPFAPQAETRFEWNQNDDEWFATTALSTWSFCSSSYCNYIHKSIQLRDKHMRYHRTKPWLSSRSHCKLIRTRGELRLKFKWFVRHLALKTLTAITADSSEFGILCEGHKWLD